MMGLVERAGTLCAQSQRLPGLQVWWRIVNVVERDGSPGDVIGPDR